jgi:hypothetical protein
MSSEEAGASGDWLYFVKSRTGKLGHELDLSELAVGDVLKIVTRNSEYLLTMRQGRDAVLVCKQAGRPSGRVRIAGCAFGRSSSIKPDHLFCGGNLELTYLDEGVPMTHRTTAIREICWRRHRR